MAHRNAVQTYTPVVHMTQCTGKQITDFFVDKQQKFQGVGGTYWSEKSALVETNTERLTNTHAHRLQWKAVGLEHIFADALIRTLIRAACSLAICSSYAMLVAILSPA